MEVDWQLGVALLILLVVTAGLAVLFTWVGIKK